MRKVLVLVFSVSLMGFFTFGILKAKAASQVETDFSFGKQYKGFVVTKSLDIPELQCHLTELTHEKSSAQVVHIQANDPENLFCISFRTYPTSSNGVAHVLEHTSLKGSKKFPVNNPFNAMKRRSLSTFMNAMTGPDYTCYPAASQVEEDFYNLFSVYLDAVFNPLLDPMAFAQEGHRLEFANPMDSATPLEHKGVVYNEMKGALSSPYRLLLREVTKELFPGSPYAYNAGGDPEEIAQLEHKDLVAFHQTHYQPSNCIFFFYGDIPLSKHLDFLSANAFDESADTSKALAPIQPQKRFSEPVRKEFLYPAAEKETQNKDIISFSWLTGQVTDNEEVLALTILDCILMNTDASPLKSKLIKSGLCKQADSLLDVTKTDIPYILFFEGCNGADADALEACIRKALQEFCQTGPTEQQITRALHQIEIARSEIAGGIFSRCALAKQHGGQAEDGIRIHSHFEKLKIALQKNPQLFQDLVQKHLLTNAHLVRLVMKPSSALAEVESKNERLLLDNLHKELTTEEIEKILSNTVALREYQAKTDVDPLPKISAQAVPKKARSFDLKKQTLGSVDVYHHEAFTNSLVYASLVQDLPQMTTEDLWLVSLFSELAPQLGVGNRSYLKNLEYIEENTGGVSCAVALYQMATNPNLFHPKLHISGMALESNGDKLFSLINAMVSNLDFSDKERIKELIKKHFVQLENSLSQNAMQYAISLSLSQESAPNSFANSLEGFEYYCKIKNLAAHLDDEIDEVCQKLISFHHTLKSSSHTDLVLTCSNKSYERFLGAGFYGLAMRQISTPLAEPMAFAEDFVLQKMQPTAYIIAAPVAFNAKSFKALSYVHPDSASLALSAYIFKNSTLHTRIREQGGAYGAGARYNPANANFYFFSYRDPNIASTLSAFDDAIAEVIAGDFDASDLEEAKLELLQNLDAPISPGSRAVIAYALLCEGKTDTMRQAFRDRLFSTNCQDIQKVTANCILPNYQQGSFVSFCGQKIAEEENKKLATPLLIE